MSVHIPPCGESQIDRVHTLNCYAVEIHLGISDQPNREVVYKMMGFYSSACQTCERGRIG